MAGNNYLTTELKKYYLLDFEQVLLLDDSFWGIPETFLRNILTEINTSKKIQSLYSKLKHENDVEDEESYLVIAYTQDIESTLTNCLETFATSFPGNLVSVDKMPPSENFNEGPESFEIGAIHNKNYFKLHHFRVTFISKSYAFHEVLWMQLKELLVDF